MLYQLRFRASSVLYPVVFSIGGNVQINDNSGKKIGRLDTSVSTDQVVTVHEIRNITTITTRDRNTGKVKTETLIGESPFGK